MKKYEYVSVQFGAWSGQPKADLQSIINEYAAGGYRYVGFLPTKQSGYGALAQIDLVFEKDV